MYLVDTSVWIDYVRDRDGPHVGFLEDILSNPQAVAISPLIYMEILQGARDIGSFRRLEKFFGGQRFVNFEQPPLVCHAAAARMSFDCKKRGITVRSSIDCLIAQCADEYSVRVTANWRVTWKMDGEDVVGVNLEDYH